VATFTDAKQRTWEIPHFDPFIIADVKQECSVSIYELPQKLSEVNELFQNVPLFANVLWVLLKEECKGRGLDQREFARGLIGGEVLKDAAEAFWKELLFFSPKNLRELLTKAEKQVDSLQAKAMGNIEKRLTENLNKLFGDLPESPDSTPEA